MCQPQPHILPYHIYHNEIPSYNNVHDNYSAVLASRSLSSSRSSSSRSSAQPSPEAKSEDDCPIGYGAFGVVWAVTDPRTNKRVALKKISNIFQSVVSCRRVYRELTMLTDFKHDNILSATDIVFSRTDNNELYVLTELMQSDLHKIISSNQTLTVEHVKIFVYQILRGLKFLHSANIIHRDIKPGNLLVNGDCKLKICDFGLARVYEPSDMQRMTQEVVTQYYRAPEILMGAKHYTYAVDMWSVGCIMAELLSRRVLFQANNPIQQLDLIVSILGTPSMDDMHGTCDPAKAHVLQLPFQNTNLALLRNLSNDVTNETLHFLLNLLSFNPRHRITASNALTHMYIDDGRTRYHTSICSCCQCYNPFATQLYRDYEPSCQKPFSVQFEDELSTVTAVKLKLTKLCKSIQSRNESLGISQLHLNLQSPVYKAFAKSHCAQVSELPPSPHLWE
ncbi:hypothetical protein HELRODRAFT_107531 [Helobdella robusta]|uniref:Mitogen-activated protein kinase n=1 Tax=Helobdella robusta TaxID=6412 RepID=T1EEA9_HELRO|nr:hypothetical protein HELRODRAFT_107531 [Helobdella robusta]ESN96461.1 hypothetical protein HELRODRAFT_107531 [Helobdella robusta]